MSLLRPLGYIFLYFKPFSNNSAIFVYYHWFYDILDYIIQRYLRHFLVGLSFASNFPEFLILSWMSLIELRLGLSLAIIIAVSMIEFQLCWVWQTFEHYHWACFSLMCVRLLTYYITHYAKQCCEGHFYQGCTYLAALLNTHIYIQIIPFLAVLYDYLSQLNHTILSCIISYDYLL